MRTTLTIDPDVEAVTKLAMKRTGLPFKTLINRALRVGLESLLDPSEAKPYRTQPKPMGLRKGLSYDNISELLAVTEGEDHR